MVMEFHPSRESAVRHTVQCYKKVLSMLMERGRRGDSSPACIQMYNVMVPDITGEVRHTPGYGLMWNNPGVRHTSDRTLMMNNFGVLSLDGGPIRDD